MTVKKHLGTSCQRTTGGIMPAFIVLHGRDCL